jgi:hypothetical protein
MIIRWNEVASLGCLFFKLCFQSSPIAALVMSASVGTILHANDEFCASPAFSCEEVIGQNHTGTELVFRSSDRTLFLSKM